MLSIFVDTYAAVPKMDFKYPQSFGGQQSISKQFSAQTPANVIHDPVPISEGTQVEDKQGNQQQPRLHCSENKCQKAAGTQQ